MLSKKKKIITGVVILAAILILGLPYRTPTNMTI